MKVFRDPLYSLLFALFVVLTAMGRAEAQVTEQGKYVTLNFANAEVVAVIQAISKISGRNFIVDPRVTGTVNILSSTPVAPEMTYLILLSALRMQGFAAIESEWVTKIVPEAEAKTHAVPVKKGGNRKQGDRLVTEVFTMQHESAAQMVQVVRPLVSPNNTVVAYPGSNTLVVTDYAENIGRIAQIIAAIDVPQHDVQVIPIQYMSALDLAVTLNRLLNEGNSAEPRDGRPRMTIIGDVQTNNLLVRSEDPSKIKAVRQLIGTFDRPGVTGNIHVIYLKNAEATRVAQTLRAIMSADGGSTPMSGDSGFTSARPASAPGTGNTGLPAANAIPPASTFGSTGGGSFSSSGSNSGGGGSSGGGSQIQADAMSNALIITAPEAIYNNLRRVVDQLDRRRAQVYVEALITEISTENAAEIGIQWQGSRSSNYVGTNFNSESGGSNIMSLASSLSKGVMLPTGNGLNLLLGGGTVSVGGVQIASLNMLAHFLETSSKANILSTPNLVTLDNEEAKIMVGRNEPFVTGQYTTNTGGGAVVGNPFQTIERKDVGITLRIKPQISEGGTVKLQIYQEASQVIEKTTLSSNGPSTSKRSIESTVLVDDGAMIALGGLVEDTYNAGEQKVPLLGDIPLLGRMFRYDTRRRGKTNLIVFLRPVILRDAASIEGISAERYQYIIGQQRGIDGQKALLGNSPAQLPPPGSPAPALSRDTAEP